MCLGTGLSISGLQSPTESERKNLGQRTGEMFKCEKVEYERGTPNIEIGIDIYSKVKKRKC